MKAEEYLAAVSRSIERFEEEMGDAFELYSIDLPGAAFLRPEEIQVVHLRFEAAIAKAFFGFCETRANLRKWPIE